MISSLFSSCYFLFFQRKRPKELKEKKKNGNFIVITIVYGSISSFSSHELLSLSISTLSFCFRFGSMRLALLMIKTATFGGCFFKRCTDYRYRQIGGLIALRGSLYVRVQETRIEDCHLFLRQCGNYAYDKRRLNAQKNKTKSDRRTIASIDTTGIFFFQRPTHFRGQNLFGGPRCASERECEMR